MPEETADNDVNTDTGENDHHQEFGENRPDDLLKPTHKIDTRLPLIADKHIAGSPDGFDEPG